MFCWPLKKPKFHSVSKVLHFIFSIDQCHFLQEKWRDSLRCSIYSGVFKATAQYIFSQFWDLLRDLHEITEPGFWKRKFAQNWTKWAQYGVKSHFWNPGFAEGSYEVGPVIPSVCPSTFVHTSVCLWCIFIRNFSLCKFLDRYRTMIGKKWQSRIFEFFFFPWEFG